MQTHTHTYSQHGTVSSANQRNRWAQSPSSCREMLARVITLLLEKTKKLCGVEKEGEEGRRRRKKWGGTSQGAKRAAGWRGHTRRETLGNVVSCEEGGKKKGVCDRQTETVFSSLRPRSYVSSMWHIQPVHGGKNIAVPPLRPLRLPLLTQTWSTMSSVSGHNPLLWNDGNDKSMYS